LGPPAYGLLLRQAAAEELLEVALAVKLYKQTVQKQESSLAGGQNKIMGYRC